LIFDPIDHFLFFWLMLTYENMSIIRNICWYVNYVMIIIILFLCAAILLPIFPLILYFLIEMSLQSSEKSTRVVLFIRRAGFL
jgi:hypothetical protein